MITEDYVSFETAKLLKEKGFNENTRINYFVGDDKPRGCVVGEMIYHKRLEEDTHLIACPTLQMAMKWLRNVHNIHFVVEPFTHDGNKIYYGVDVLDKDLVTVIYENLEDNTYEKACEAAIKYCLENLI